MTKEKVIALIRATLLTFALVSIGVFIGKTTATPPPVADNASQAENSAEPHVGSKVIVYSMHPTIRCWDCIQIETMTKDLLNETFPDELADGSVEFKSVDYFQNPVLASRYNVATSTVVIAYYSDGEETHFERLDDVWTKMRNRDEFASYVFGSILSVMEGGVQ